MASNGMGPGPQLCHKKMMYNSTSSVHVVGTISNPDRVSTLICIGLLLQGRTLKDLETNPTGNIDSEFNLIPSLLPEFGGLEPLDEIPLSRLESDARGNCELLGKIKAGCVPMSSSIVGFIGMLQYATDSPLECVIIAYMYLNRILKASKMALTFQNWRMLWIMAFILAHKAWDEKPELLSTFALLVPGVSKQQLRSLEWKVLQMIDYNTSCSHKDYVKQYFELYIAYLNEIRTLDAFIVWRFKPLTPLGAKRLELRSSSLCMSRPSSRGGSTRRTSGAPSAEDVAADGGAGGAPKQAAAEYVRGDGASSHQVAEAAVKTDEAATNQAVTESAGGDECVINAATATSGVHEALDQTVTATLDHDCVGPAGVGIIFAPVNPITLSASAKPFVPQRETGLDKLDSVTNNVADNVFSAETQIQGKRSSMAGGSVEWREPEGDLHPPFVPNAMAGSSNAPLHISPQGLSAGISDGAVGGFASMVDKSFRGIENAAEVFAVAALTGDASYGPARASAFDPQQYRNWTELTGEELQRMSEEAAQGAPGGDFPAAQHHQHLFYDADHHIHNGYNDDAEGGGDDDDGIDLHAVDDDSEMGYMLRRQQFERDEAECERMDREYKLRCMFERGPGQPIPTRRWSFDGATEGEHFRFVLN